MNSRTDPVGVLEDAIDFCHTSYFSGADHLPAFAAAERAYRAVGTRDDVAALSARGRFHTLAFHVRLSRGEQDVDHARAAVALLRAAAGHTPRDGRIQANLADAALALAWSSDSLLQATMIDVSRRAATRALELDPGCALAHAVVGVLALFTPPKRGGSAEVARVHLARAVVRAPQRRDWLVWLAQALDATGREDEARELLRAAGLTITAAAAER